MAKRKYMSLEGNEFFARETEITAFQDAVEEIVEEYDCSYMEAVERCCDNMGIDIESVSSLISPTLKNLIRGEAVELNLLVDDDSGDSILDF